MINAPKFLSFSESLKKRIISGQWPVGSFLPSIRKLQDQFSLSRNTVVSGLRILQDEGLIAREGASRQGYRIVNAPDDVTVLEAGSCQQAVKFILPFNYWNYVGSMLIESAEAEFSRSHISFLFSNHKNNLAEEERILNRIEAGSHNLLRAMFLMSSSSYDYPHLDQIRRIQGLLPVILVDRYIEGLDAHYIGIDNHYIGRESVRRLKDMGHERIAFFGGFSRISTVWERLQGARAAADRLGIEMRDEWVVMKPFLFESFDAMVRSGEVLAEKFLNLTDHPTAVICASDKLATGLFRGLIAAGLRIPEDVSLIGCDDDQIQRSSLPKVISSWSYPFEDMAHEASELFTSLEDNPGRPIRRVELIPGFIDGDTVTKPRS